MKKLSAKNINTSGYFNRFYKNKEVEKRRILRQKEIQKHIFGKRIIELGCGISYLLPMIKKRLRRAELWGLDFSDVALSKMRTQFPDINWIFGDAICSPFRDDYFDTVISSELIEHIEKPHRLAEEMFRITKNGGRIIISTPQLEIRDKEHLWEFDEESLRRIFYGYGKVKIYSLPSKIFEGRKYIFLICYVKK